MDSEKQTTHQTTPPVTEISSQTASGQKLDREQLLEELVRLINDPESRIEDIGKVLRRVPGLAPAIMRRANSTEFSLQHQVSRVEHAIMILGLRRTLDTINKQRHRAHRQAPAPHFPIAVVETEANLQTNTEIHLS